MTAAAYVEAIERQRESDLARLATFADAPHPEPEIEPGTLRPVEVARMMDATLAPPRFVVADWIPRGVLTLLGAHGGSGKSLLALTLCAHVTQGRAFGDLDVSPGRALFVSLEDAGDVVLHRLRRIVEAFGLNPSTVAQRLTVLDGSEADAALASEFAHDGVRMIGPTPTMHAVADAAPGHDFIVIDNASDAFGGNENDRRQVRAFVRALARIAKDADAGLLLLAHVDKAAAKFGANGNAYSGSTAWNNSARSRLAMTGEDGGVEVAHEKANFGRVRAPLRLTWSDAGVLVPAGAGADQSAAQAESDAADAVAVLAAIADAERSGAVVGTGRTGPATTRHALLTFPDLPKHLRGSGKDSKERFWAAVTRCQREGWIEGRNHTGPSRNQREVFAVTAAGASVLGARKRAAYNPTPLCAGTHETHAAGGIVSSTGTDETHETDAAAYLAARGEQ
jgi:hypothetical protein